MMKKTKKVLAWVVYIVVLAAVFLYLLFPAGAVKKYLEQLVSRSSENRVSIEISAVRPGFPPSLVLSGINLVYRQTDAIKIGRTVLSPAYRKLPDNFAAVDFEAALGQGRALGRVAMEEGGSDEPGVFLDMRLESADLESFVLIPGMSGHTVSGSLDGTIEFDGAFPGQNGSGAVQLSASQCTVVFREAVYGLKQLTFQRVEADLEIEGQQVNIKKLRLEGSQLSAEGTGRMLIRRPLENSRIQLSANVKPHPALLKAVGGLLPRQSINDGNISVRIAGTLNRPSWRIR